ncbi:MAG TPA: DoxX family protein [Gemmatimonadales bacterium]|nr:DoxX family protein [Gemmatimonadales bacterium]
MQIRKLFFSTSDDPALTLARVLLGTVMFAHGAQKALGWFGGYGWDGTMAFFTQQMGIPALFAVLAILAEFLGGLGLITGLLGRVAALGVLSNMVVAALMVHAKVGFFMNWYGAQQGEGYEYHILASALALLIIWKGSGAYSADRLIAARA